MQQAGDRDDGACSREEIFGTTEIIKQEMGLSLSSSTGRVDHCVVCVPGDGGARKKGGRAYLLEENEFNFPPISPNSHFFSIYCLVFSRDPSLEGYEKVGKNDYETPTR